MQFDDPEQGVVLKHSLADRNFYIKTLRDKFGWKLDDIGARMKLTSASVSRILAEKQGGPKKARKARRKKNKTAPGAASGKETTNGFVPAEFFNVLGQLVAAYGDNREAVQGFLPHVDPAVIASTERMVAEFLGNNS